MTQASSDDLRERVLGAVASGTSARAAARRFGIGAATAVAWADCQRQTGEATARRQAPATDSVLVPAVQASSYFEQTIGSCFVLDP